MSSLSWKDRIDDDFVPDPSHQMGAWGSDIFQMESADRFGSSRACTKCSAEEGKVGRSRMADRELIYPCYYEGEQ